MRCRAHPAIGRSMFMHTRLSRPRLRFIETPDPAAGGGSPADQPTETEEPKGSQGDPDNLGESGKRALAAERDARKAAEKAAADALAKVKAFEDAQKTDTEKAADALADAQKAAAESAARALRYEAAAAEGLPLSAAGRLVGDTLEALRDDAKALKALLGTSSGTPRPDPTQGGGSNSKTASVGAGRDMYADRRKK